LNSNCAHDPREDQNWTTLSTHIDDESLNAEYATHFWTLDVTPKEEGKDGFYRLFRIIQVGPNLYKKNNPTVSNDSWGNVLVAGGFDLFGTLKECDVETRVERVPSVTEDSRPSKKLEFPVTGPNGIIFSLGGYPTVQVLSSGIGQGKVEDFINRKAVTVWTTNYPFSWFLVDFGDRRKVKPSHYILRYSSSGDACCFRSWQLQATNNLEATLTGDSNDPRWTVLSTHVNDQSISSEFEEKTFPLINVPNKTYRYFRVIQTGPNKLALNEGWKDVFVAGGFELFGDLIEYVNAEDSTDKSGKKEEEVKKEEKSGSTEDNNNESFEQLKVLIEDLKKDQDDSMILVVEKKWRTRGG